MKWILAVIACEALTELLVNAEILDRPRNFLCKISFFRSLFECGYCMSFWTGLFVFGVLLLKVEIVLVPIVLHRSSNYLHDLYKFIKNRKKKNGGLNAIYKNF
jgi:hypothetical protein